MPCQFDGLYPEGCKLNTVKYRGHHTGWRAADATEFRPPIPPRFKERARPGENIWLLPGWRTTWEAINVEQPFKITVHIHSISIYIHIYIYMCVLAHASVYVYTHLAHAYLYEGMSTCIYINTNIYIYVHVCMCMYTYIH